MTLDDCPSILIIELTQTIWLRLGDQGIPLLLLDS